MTKVCTGCLETRPLDDFGPDTRGKHGRKARCRPCLARASAPRNARLVEERKRRLREDPSYRLVVREGNLRFKYGMSLDDYAAMLQRQGGRCAICGTTEPGPTGHFHVDHDHRCCPDRGKKTCGSCVRALLCNHCNLGIGHFNDNPALLSAAAEYLIGAGVDG